MLRRGYVSGACTRLLDLTVAEGRPFFVVSGASEVGRVAREGKLRP